MAASEWLNNDGAASDWIITKAVFGAPISNERLVGIMPSPLPRFLTTQEVAELLRTSPETVRYWRHVGKGPKSFKIGRRVLYAAEDVEAFVADAQRDQS